jgi:leader peptidase (prepilin peptidase)/N-methyltransferase
MGLRVVGAVLAGALGASVASFLAVVVERVPRGESLGGRSRCVCGAQIRAADNVPIVGYLVRRGRSRCCGAPIPARYFVAELVGAVLGVVLFLAVSG